MSSKTDTPLDIPLTTIQGSFVASVVCIGGLVGTPFYGTLADKFGRKVSVLVSAIPCAVRIFKYFLIAIKVTLPSNLNKKLIFL